MPEGATATKSEEFFNQGYRCTTIFSGESSETLCLVSPGGTEVLIRHKFDGPIGYETSIWTEKDTNPLPAFLQDVSPEEAVRILTELTNLTVAESARNPHPDPQVEAAMRALATATAAYAEKTGVRTAVTVIDSKGMARTFVNGVPLALDNPTNASGLNAEG